jgi:hypothetical protein
VGLFGANPKTVESKSILQSLILSMGTPDG